MVEDITWEELPWGDAGDKWKFVSGFLSAQLLAIEMLRE
jgi:hypothetical protein